MQTQTPIQQALQKIDSAIEMWKTPTKEMDALKTLVNLYQEISALQNSSEKTITITENENGAIKLVNKGFSAIEVLGILRFEEKQIWIAMMENGTVTNK